MMQLLADLLERPLNNGYTVNDQYVILEFIGRGSYGLVYLAVDKVTNQTVVVKQQRKRRAKGKIISSYLRKESNILSNLKHPQIPKYMNFITEDNKHFLIMEYIDGKNFEDLILGEGFKLDEVTSLNILLEVLKVIEYLHNKGIVHRDLRLPNIIIKNLQVYVIDFGLAISLDEDVIKDFSHEFPLEKRLFREPSVKSDFYALGHFLLFLLYSTYEVTSRKKRSWEEELNISAETRKIIRRLLRMDTSYESIGQVIEDVRATALKLGYPETTSETSDVYNMRSIRPMQS
jgi:serine/threonine-protein kinase